MERVWKCVQSAGRHSTGGNAAVGTASKSASKSTSGPDGDSANAAALASAAAAQAAAGTASLLSGRPQVSKQSTSSHSRRRTSSGRPQTIVCGCEQQPCSIHPVLIRVRRSQRQAQQSACHCPPDKQPCAHAARSAGLRRKRCNCTEQPCCHTPVYARRRPPGLSSLFATSSAAAAAALSAGTGGAPHCPHGDGEVCDCRADAQLCLHPVKSTRARRDCNCANQPCQQHRAPQEGRIKRVKCRVRRAGCAMARCTAELAMLHLHWELGGECAPCRPRAFSRRLCGRQQSDNELYRSNSFKFERFERNADENLTPMRKQVLLCDEYSLPVDFVNKKRVVNKAAAPTTTIQWSIPSPTVEAVNVEVIEHYSDPKDSKTQASIESDNESLQPTSYNKFNHKYHKRYLDPSDSESSSEDEEITDRVSSVTKPKNTNHNTVSSIRNPLVQERKYKGKSETGLNSAEWGIEKAERDAGIGNAGGSLHLENFTGGHCRLKHSPTESLPSRHPSPYYYGDLFRASAQQQHRGTDYFVKYRKSASLDVPVEQTNSLNFECKCNLSGDAADGEHAPDCKYISEFLEHVPEPAPLDRHVSEPLNSAGRVVVKNADVDVISSCIITEWDYTLMPPHRLLSHDLPTTVCTCVASAEEDELELPKLSSTNIAIAADNRLESSARHKVQKRRVTQNVEPQSALIEDLDDVGELQNKEGEEDEEYEDDEEEDRIMSRQRQIYETAFDCKISRSDDDLDDPDKITNHPVLITQMKNSLTAPLSSRASSSAESSKQSQQNPFPSSQENRRKGVMLRPKTFLLSRQKQQHTQSNPSQTQITQQAQQQTQSEKRQSPSENMLSLLQDVQSIHTNLIIGDKSDSLRIKSWGYTPSQPSTAPLPVKFQNRKPQLLNVRSAPNLPSQHLKQQLEQQQDVLENHLQSESLSPQSSENSILEIKSRPKSFSLQSKKQIVIDCKSRSLKSEQRPRPCSLVRDAKSIMEFKGRPHDTEKNDSESQFLPEKSANLLEVKLRRNPRRPGYSSTESMATSSSGGSMESLRSSTSEGNRSTSSSESRHSTSLSSHSSDSGNTGCSRRRHHGHQQSQQQSSLSNFLTHQITKLHILSPISDKSSQEPASETSDNNRNNNSQKPSPEDNKAIETSLNLDKISVEPLAPSVTTPTDSSFKKRRVPQNKNLINLALQSSSSGDAEIQGSDSGISIESRAGIKCNKLALQPIKTLATQQQLQIPSLPPNNEQEISDLPFDMPKLRRRRLLMQQDVTTSGSTTSVDFKDLPFDMPKLRRRMRCMQSMESNTSQACSSNTVRDSDAPLSIGNSLTRSKMTLNLGGGNSFGSEASDDLTNQLGSRKPNINLGLPLEHTISRGSVDLVDVQLPLERQGWYHGSITRIEAEAVLRLLREGSYLVRNSESTKQDYSLSLKSARGFMHMRIQKNEELNAYILGQFSKPFDSIPEMVRHFSINRLPIRGAEHMCLLHPVIAQLL